MKIAFVTCTEENHRTQMPLGIAYLSAIVKKNHEAVDTRWIVGKEPCRLIEAILGFSPDIVAFSATSLEFGALKAVSDAVRSARPGLPIFWGGYHLTMVPEDLPASATAAVLGEGETAFGELVELCAVNRLLDVACLSTLKGIAYRSNGGVVTTGRREQVRNLDDLPMPDWTLFKEAGCVPSLISSRGCLFNCSFCSSTAFWGHGLRRHSAERVVAEMVRLYELYPGASMLNFYDDTFTDDVHRLERIASIIDEKGHMLPQIWGHGRAALINQRMLRVLKRLKVLGLSFGFESGSNRVLKRIKSGLATMGVNFRAGLACYEYGIEAHTHIIIGNPGETIEDATQSLNLIYMTPLGYVALNTALPLPGTKFMEAAEERGIRLKADDYAQIDVKRIKPYLIDRMTAEEFWRMRGRLEDSTAGQELVCGKKRYHLLVGIPWAGSIQEMTSALTAIYSVDYSVGLHVVLFGVPGEYENAIYRQFPVVIPEVGSEPEAATGWLSQNAREGIPWIFLESGSPFSQVLHKQLCQGLNIGFRFMEDWAAWRIGLEKNNDRFLRRDLPGAGRCPLGCPMCYVKDLASAPAAEPDPSDLKKISPVIVSQVLHTSGRARKQSEGLCSI